MSAKRTLDMGALYAALDSRRHGERKSWRDVAATTGLSPSHFTRIAQGRGLSLDAYIRLTDWLGVSMDSFIQGPKPTQEEAEETVAAISRYLRRDRALKPGSAGALEAIVRAAYDEMADCKEGEGS